MSPFVALSPRTSCAGVPVISVGPHGAWDGRDGWVVAADADEAIGTITAVDIAAAAPIPSAQRPSLLFMVILPASWIAEFTSPAAITPVIARLRFMATEFPGNRGDSDLG